MYILYRHKYTKQPSSPQKLMMRKWHQLAPFSNEKVIIGSRQQKRFSCGQKVSFEFSQMVLDPYWRKWLSARAANYTGLCENLNPNRKRLNYYPDTRRRLCKGRYNRLVELWTMLNTRPAAKHFLFTTWNYLAVSIEMSIAYFNSELLKLNMNPYL